MRYNVIGYFISEGFRNVFKNKKSTFSCLGVMCATMLLFGLFFAIGRNITHMVEGIEDSQAIRVFANIDTSQEDLERMKNEIESIKGVVPGIKLVTPEEAYNEMKERLEDKAYTMDIYEPTIFSYSYIVTLSDLNLNDSIQEQIYELDNIKRISSSNDTIRALSVIGKWIRIITGILLAILIVISIFIISNTIKLTVHARRKEISIMKYVGATNSFVRTPFVIEGILIGIMSSFLSVVLVGGIYNWCANKMRLSETIQNINVDILSFNELFTQIIIVYVILGVGIGIIGSTISMRKYLDV